jgi:hypothetical protein
MNDLGVGLYTSNLYFSAPDRVSKVFLSRVRSCPCKASFATRRFYLFESECRIALFGRTNPKGQLRVAL